MDEPVTSRQSAPDGAARPASLGSILVVDDDLSNREVLSRRLARQGYAVQMAADGAEALRRISDEPYDLVLLDVMMPGMGGLEALSYIRKTKPATELPVIMATAKDQSDDLVHAFELGASDYVTKPLDFQVVMARVRTQLQLKRSVERILDLEHSLSLRNEELEAANQQMRFAADRARAELEAAAKVQLAFLPTVAPTVPGLEFTWSFLPCEELAGDSLSVFPLGPNHVGMFVLDVSGHGVASSLMAVAASRILSVADGADSLLLRAGEGGVLEPVAPATVGALLNERFTWDADVQQFMTLFYAVVDVRARKMTYISAGHPGPVVLSGDGGTATILPGSGVPIGVNPTVVYEQKAVLLKPGDRVYLYSDGVTETMNPEHDLFGDDRMLDALREGRAMNLTGSIALLLERLREWQGAGANGMTSRSWPCNAPADSGGYTGHRGRVNVGRLQTWRRDNRSSHLERRLAVRFSARVA